MEERAERKSSERNQRRKSKLDDMATLSRIEEKAEDEEGKGSESSEGM